MGPTSPVRVPLLLGTVILAACTADTDPVQPNAPGDVLAPDFAVASNSWSIRRHLPSGRLKMGAGVVKNANGEPIVYLLGGVDFDGQTRRVDAYNFSTDIWTSKRAQGGRHNANGAGVIGNKLYQTGGYGDDGKPLSHLVVYDPGRDIFTRKANMPVRSVGGVTGVIGGKLYVLTGFGTDCTCRVINQFYRYDPATNGWTRLSAPPNPHANGAAAVVGGKFYVAGGSETNPGPWSKKLHAYNPVTNKWSTLAPIPYSVPGLAGAAIGNEFYVIGGGSGQVQAYNPATNTWRSRARLNSWRIDLAAVSFVSKAGNPRILAIGGQGDDDWPSNWNEVYTP